MAYKRDRTLKLAQYIKDLGIILNLRRNKAGGNKGFFKTNNRNVYRIDISYNLTDEETLSVLVHEMVHYVHFMHDKTLKSLDFIFEDNYENYEEDLLKLTVDTISKEFATNLLNKRNVLKKDIADATGSIKKLCPDIRLSDKNNRLYKEISKLKFKYLLKYDRVRMFSVFNMQIYSTDNISQFFPDIKKEYVDYLKLCSLKRKLRNINSKISRLNNYYTSPSELLARSFEYFILKPDYMKTKTPNLYKYYSEILNNKEQSQLSIIKNIISLVN